MSKNDIPGDSLAADASLAVEHTPERAAEQLAYLGGELDDDVDAFDATGLDDGSVLPEDYDETKPAPAASLSDDDDGETGDEDDSDDDSAGDVEDSADDGDDDPTGDADESDESSGKEDAPAGKGIPKHRFDEVNERRKAAETENERLRAQIAAGKPPTEEEAPYNLRAAEKEYMDFLLDGDTDSALAKREEIDAAKEAKWMAASSVATRTERNVEASNTDLLSLSHEAQEMFDVFNPDHADYNQGMLDKVLVFMKGYEASGTMSRSDAFVAGLADVVDMYDLMPEDGDAANKGEEKPTGKKKVVDKTKATAMAHQPVAGQGQGSAQAGAVVPNINDMSDEELDALPEKTLARMRGDIL